LEARVRKSKQTPPKQQGDRRKRHGFRGMPPPPTFSLKELPDDAHLREEEVAAILRISRSTVTSKRLKQLDHPLVWVTLPGGFVRAIAGSLREYVKNGVSRRRPEDEIAAGAAQPLNP